MFLSPTLDIIIAQRLEKKSIQAVKEALAEDVVLYYDHLMEHLHWKNLGHVLAGGNMDVGDVKGKAEVEEAYQLGASIK